MFFAGLVGIPADDLVSLIDSNETQIEASGIELWSYISPGDTHTILHRPEFYTQTVNGVALVDGCGPCSPATRWTTCTAASAPPPSMGATMDHVVVVGASLAGLRTCEGLRQEGFTGRITLLGVEAEVPYDRPPLSKKMLTGEFDADRVRVRPRKSRGLTSTCASALRPPASTPAPRWCTSPTVYRSATTAGDRHRCLAVRPAGPARGSTACSHCARWPSRSICGMGLARRRHCPPGGDRRRLHRAGGRGPPLASWGARSPCWRACPAPLMRGLGAQIGHCGRGRARVQRSELRCAWRVAGLEGTPAGRVSGVRLEDGEVVPADVVLVGVGVAPNTAWLESSGLQLR